MSTTAPQTSTPQNIAELATQTAQLDRLAVIGIFGSRDAPAALIRQRNGEVKRVTLGDRIANRTVTAIGTDRVILSRGANSKTLTLPKG